MRSKLKKKSSNGKSSSKKNKKPKRGGPIRLAAIPDYGDDQVLSVAEWTTLNNLSLHSGYRILSGPDAPVTTQLSDNRIGVTRRNNRDWQKSRARV
jgi:hypothetical protein